MKKICKPTNFILFILIVFNSIFLFNFTKKINIDKEIITIRAMGNSNVNAKGNEIWIRKILVDNKEQNLDKPLEGNWILQSINNKDIYGWRTYDHPYNITDEIKWYFSIGKNIEIFFEKNIWRGFVEVKYNDKTYIVDCYENTQNTENLTSLIIECSSEKNIIFFLKLFFMIFIFVFIEFKLIRNIFMMEDSKFYYMKLREELFVILLLIVMFLIMYSTSNTSLWGDDLYNLGFVYDKKNLLEAIEKNKLFIDSTPPLFNLIAYYWVKIVPYGEKWLFLISEIFVIIGIYILYKASKLKFTSSISIFVVIIAISSTSLMINGGHEFRAYGLLFMFSSLFIYSYYYRYKENLNKKSIVLFGISIALFSYSHYHGVIVCVGMFIYDIFDNIKTRKYRFVYSYIIAFILYFPWIIILLKNKIDRVVFWYSNFPKPDFYKLLLSFYFIVSNNKLLLIMFIYAIVCYFSKYSKLNSKNESLNKNIGVLLFLIFFTIILSYLINILGLMNRIFMDKFFISVMPMVFILLGLILNIFFEIIYSKLLDKKNIIKIIISMVLLLIIDSYIVVKNNPKFAPYPSKEIANYIKNQNDFNNDGVCIISPDNEIEKGFDYLITEKGKYGKINLFDSKKIEEYKKIYVIYCWAKLSDELQEDINKKYNLIFRMDNNYLEVYELKHI